MTAAALCCGLEHCALLNRHYLLCARMATGADETQSSSAVPDTRVKLMAMPYFGVLLLDGSASDFTQVRVNPRHKPHVPRQQNKPCMPYDELRHMRHDHTQRLVGWLATHGLRQQRYHAHGRSGAGVASLKAQPLGGRAAATPQLPSQQLPRSLLYGFCQDLLQHRQGPVLARAVSGKACCLHSQIRASCVCRGNQSSLSILSVRTIRRSKAQLQPETKRQLTISARTSSMITPALWFFTHVHVLACAQTEYVTWGKAIKSKCRLTSKAGSNLA